MTTPDRDEVLRQVLEIVDMFENENMRMAADTILCNPALDSRRMGPADLAEHLTTDGHIHTAMHAAAHLIGDAIRERFGLPPKEG
jgi:hypothetical protein